MNNNESHNDAAPLIYETLEKHGEISFVSAGRSMLPVIRDGKDTVTVAKPRRDIKAGDVAFYQRDNGQFILQRVMFVNGGTLVLRGDNQWGNEYNVGKDRIIGVLKSFERNGKEHSVRDRDYLLYVRVLPLIRFFRKYFYLFKSQVYKFVKYLVKR
mgnify:FL=1